MQVFLFKTGERPIYWQELLKDFKEDQILRTVHRISTISEAKSIS